MRVGLLRSEGLAESADLLGLGCVLCGRGDDLGHEIEQYPSFVQVQRSGVRHGIGGSGQQIAYGHWGLQSAWQQADGQVKRA